MDGNPGVENSGHTLHFDNVYMYNDCHDVTFSGGSMGASPRFGVEMWDDTTGGYNLVFSGVSFAHTSDATLDFASAEVTPAASPTVASPARAAAAASGRTRSRWGGGHTTVAISGCHFARGEGPSVDFETGTNTFENNTIDCTVDNGYYSADSEPYAKIQVETGSSGNTITGNTVIPALTSGYAVALFGSHNICTGNTLYKGDTNYIDNTGTSNTTTPNTLV